MKITAEAVFQIVFGLGALSVVFGAGAIVGARRATAARLQEMGLNRRSAALYLRAVRLLHTIGSDGALGDETRLQVRDWVSDHRRKGRC